MRSSGVLVGTCFGVPSFRPLVLLLTLALSTAGCAREPRRDATTPLRIGIFAADARGSQQELAARYRPLTTYLQARLGQPVQLEVSSNAQAVLDAFEARTLDVVFHRAFAFPHAHVRAGAIPLVTRQEDRQTTSVFVTLTSDPRQSLQDFRGTRLSFSLRRGSSYVMGRHYLEQQQIDAETFFSDVSYASVADEAIDRLRHGQADICVVSSIAMLRMFSSGTLKPAEIKVVAETPPHVGELWFASPTLPADLRLKVRDAFLSLSPDRTDEAAILKLLGATAYVPTTLDEYQQLTDLMRQMQLLDGTVG